MAPIKWGRVVWAIGIVAAWVILSLTERQPMSYEEGFQKMVHADQGSLTADKGGPNKQ